MGRRCQADGAGGAASRMRVFFRLAASASTAPGA